MYQFTAPVQLLDEAHSFVHHALYVPAAIVEEMRAHQQRRLIGTLNDLPFNLALQSRAGEPERFLLLSRQTLRALKARAGELVTVICRPDTAPQQPTLPEELTEVLLQEPEAAARFYALTPGRQRSLAHYVSTAKRLDTRISRALDLAKKLRTNTLYGDLHPENR